MNLNVPTTPGPSPSSSPGPSTPSTSTAIVTDGPSRTEGDAGGSSGGGSGSTTGGNATGSGRTRVALAPGHSLMDWIKLCSKHPDMAGTNGVLRKVTKQELAQHNTKDDCWIALNGKVYNVTCYLAFHPGGEDELMRGAGTDATKLFNSVHQYVNFASMLRKCHVGDYCPAHSPLMDVQSCKPD